MGPIRAPREHCHSSFSPHLSAPDGHTYSLPGGVSGIQRDSESQARATQSESAWLEREETEQENNEFSHIGDVVNDILGKKRGLRCQIDEP